ncbi:MAG: DUF3256 family protein [Prevotella sp.]|nr:DUF3256 family protein [Prevotella sp.]
MKNIISTVFLLFLSQQLFAQNTSIRDAWVNMPDSMLVYLNQSMRKDHLDFYDMKVSSEVKNKLEGMSVMDTLTTDYVSFKMDQNVDLQIKMLQTPDSTKNIICLIKTLRAPEAESEVCFYTSEWVPLSESFGLPLSTDADSLIANFMKCPSEMSAETYASLCQQIEYVMLNARWDISQDNLVLSISVPVFAEQEKVKFKSVVLQRKFKWNGIIFKES